MSDSNERPARKRSLTDLTLNWLAEKLRRSEQLKNEVKSGEYRVESEELARALVNQDGASS